MSSNPTQNKTEKKKQNSKPRIPTSEGTKTTNHENHTSDEKKGNPNNVPNSLGKVCGWIKKSSPTDWIIACFTMVLAIVSYHQWDVLKEQRDVLKDQGEVVREQSDVIKRQLAENITEFHVTHRPWCAISGDIETTSPLVFESGEIKTGYRYTIKNCGYGPALRQTEQFSIKLGTMNELHAYSQRIPPCDIEDMDFITKITGNIILPGEKYCSPEGITSARINPPNTKTAIMLELCIAYRDEFGDLHHTGDRWNYVTSDGEREFLIKGIIPGHWEHYGFGNTAN